MTSTAAIYSVSAYNVSHASENKIHDDAIAKKLGFAGGLVPGVEVYAYATHLAVERWGLAFLERGRFQCRFLKPVYDGRTAAVTAKDASGSGIDIEVTSEGILCATGSGTLPQTVDPPPSVAAYEWHAPPAHAARPPADETSLAQGKWLATVPSVLTAVASAQYLEDVRESLPIYAEDNIAHPGILLRLCNSALRENVVLAPWIHTGSKVRNLATAHVGDSLEARARVAANYERKGHRFVDLDVLIIANGAKPIAHVLHTAAYRLRHLSAA